MMKTLCSCIITCLFFWLTVYAQTDTTGSATRGGIVKIKDKFQIFPENRLGNTLYLKNKKLVSKENLILEDVVEAPDGHIYRGTDENQNTILGYTGDPNAQFLSMEKGFYQLNTNSEGIVRRRLYWVNNKKEIIEILPQYKTTGGLVHNQADKAVLYHIAKGENVVTAEGKEVYQYSFRLHIINTKTGDIRHLPETILDFSPKLRLGWSDKDTVQYFLSNGTKETIKVP